MFFRGWNGGYYAPKTQIPKDYIDAVPEGVIPVYWDYYSKDENRYDDMIYNHRQLNKDVWFAGGAWTWRGFTPDNGYTLKTMIPAVNACKKPDNFVERVLHKLQDIQRKIRKKRK